MRMRTQRILAALLSLVLLLALAPAGWAVDLTKPNTVIVDLKSGPYYEKDLKDVALTIDLYQISKAIEVPGYDTYQYEKLTGDLEPFQTDLDNILVAPKGETEEAQAEADEEHAKAMAKFANDISAVVLATDAKPVYSGSADAGAETITVASDIAAGLYLLVPHGTGLTDYIKTVDVLDSENKPTGQKNTVSIAQSDVFEYLFSPQLVTVPAKINEDGVHVYNTAEGTWTYTLKVVLKPDQKERNGSLKIRKIIEATSYADTRATFVFHVKAKLNGNSVFDDICEITIPDNEKQEVVIEKKIPIGAEVEVEEVYDGSRYQPSKPPFEITIGADAEGEKLIINNETDDTKIATIEFTNVNDGTPKEGYGILNTFTFNGSQWVWNGETEEEPATE